MSNAIIKTNLSAVSNELLTYANNNRLTEDDAKKAMLEALAESAKREYDLPNDCTAKVVEKLEEQTQELQYLLYRKWMIADYIPEEVDRDQLGYGYEDRLPNPENIYTTPEQLEEISDLTPDQANELIGKQYDQEIGYVTGSRINSHAFKTGLRTSIQRLKREAMAREYEGKSGAIISGTVKNVPMRKKRRSKDLFIELSETQADAILPSVEQMKGDRINPGDHIQAVLKEVEQRGRSGPRIILSRTAPELVHQLLKKEVPEIMDNVIEVVAIAREADICTKVAIRSFDARIDAVGACVGMRGSRIKNVMRALHDERLDIVQWNPDPQQFIAEALGLKADNDFKVKIDEGRKEANFIVDTSLLPRTIGTRGSNVRLVNQLTGWIVSVDDEEGAAARAASKEKDLSTNLAIRLDISQNLGKLLLDNNYTIDKIADADNFDNILELLQNNGEQLTRLERESDLEELTEKMTETAFEIDRNSKFLQENVGDIVERRDEMFRQMNRITSEFSHAMANKLVVYGIDSLQAIAEAGSDELEAKAEIHSQLAERLIIEARKSYDS